MDRSAAGPRTDKERLEDRGATSSVAKETMTAADGNPKVSITT